MTCGHQGDLMGNLLMTFLWQRLAERLDGYEHFTAGARLRQLLAAQGGIRNQEDAVGNRLAELKGLQGAPDQLLRRYNQDSSELGVRVLRAGFLFQQTFGSDECSTNLKPQRHLGLST